MRPHALVMAKAPVAGRVKTRLGHAIGMEAAASIAAAALADTIEACAAAFGPDRCRLALAGDLGHASDGPSLEAQLAGWSVFPQRGDSFSDRLAHAHLDSGGQPVVQVGMDTPQLTPALLTGVADALDDSDAVLGAAEDGGWWVLALRDPSHAEALRGVAMSSPTTYDDTRVALERRGLSVGSAPTLRDVDTAGDAEHVAGLAPSTRFAAAWKVRG